MTNRLVDPLLLERPLALEWPQREDRKPVRKGSGSRSKRASMLALVLFVAALGFGALAMPAAADRNTRCVGTVIGVHDNVVVPEGAHCTLLFATVRGNVHVLHDASLHIDGATTVQGDVQATDEPDWISIPSGNTFRGDIQVTGVTGGPPPGPPFFGPRNLICSNTVQNNIQILESAAGTSWSIGNGAAPPCGGSGLTIEHGNLQVEKNRGDVTIGNVTVGGAPVLDGPGGNLQAVENLSVSLFFNIVRQNLQCFDNRAVAGNGNVAEKKEGQCATV